MEQIAIIIDFKYSSKSMVDFSFLKQSYENGRLQGADVLAKLLGIDDNTPFKVEKFNKNIFKDFDISCRIWNYIIIFLKTGIMPVDNYLDILHIMEVSIILGGIPSIDEYYIEYKKKELKNKKKYNPQKPEEDDRQLYDWKIQKDTEFSNFQRSEIGKLYTPCKIFRIAPSSVTEYVYFRKLKDNIDLSEEYEMNEEINEELDDEVSDDSDDEVNEYEQLSVNQALSNIHLQLMEE